MRLRFFWITFLLLFFVSVALVTLHGWFLREERRRLIDEQVRAAAEALLDSELGGLRRVKYERVDEIISEELGENRIGKFFVIRGAKNEVIYESSSAQVLPLLSLPQAPQWVTVREKGQFIRVLNLALPRIQDRTMQVGVILDDGLLSLFPPARAALIFVVAALALGLAAAGLLTSFLFSPISQLRRAIAGLAIDEGRELPSLILAPGEMKSADEFASLRRGIAQLIDRVNRGYRTSRAWSFQMAHELKTPLAILEAEIADGLTGGKLDPALAESLRDEIMQASAAVTSFLTWAELESGGGSPRLYATRIGGVLAEIKARLDKQFPDRIFLDVAQDFTVLSAPLHLDLLLLNLVRNALVHSNSGVTITAAESAVEVRDHGPGLPVEVRERLGEPFNKGGGKGHGLGLALVSGICRQYDWQLTFAEPPGTTVRVRFPEL